MQTNIFKPTDDGYTGRIRLFGIQAMGPPGGDRTTVEFAALLTEALGGYRIPPQHRSPVTSIA